MLCLLALFFLTTIKTANIFSYITFFSFFSSCIIALRSTTWLLSCFTSVFSNQPLICWFFYITGFVLTFFSLHHSVLSPTLSLRFSVIIFIYVFFFWKQLFLVSNSLLQAGRIDSCNKTISYGGNYLHQKVKIFFSDFPRIKLQNITQTITVYFYIGRYITVHTYVRRLIHTFVTLCTRYLFIGI